MCGDCLYQISPKSAMICKNYGVDINLPSRVQYGRHCAELHETLIPYNFWYRTPTHKFHETHITIFGA